MRSAELEQKLATLMSLAADDREGRPPPPRLRHTDEVGALRPLNIRDLRPRAGVRMRLLRILMTNACSFNCHYCPMRRDRPLPRSLLKPEELVRIFLGALRRGWCEGLFVTTGIPGRPAHVTDELIKALELLRERHRFAGYIHVKLVPGAEDAQIERLTALASRVSINFETPCGATLARIAPEKRFDVTLGNFERVRGLVMREREARAHGRPADPLHPGGSAGMTMQFVVGATPDTDRDLIGAVAAAPRARRRAPRALQRLPSHRPHTHGGRAGGARTARAPALPGVAPPVRVRLRGRRDPVRGGAATSRSPPTRRRRGRWRIRSAFRSSCAPRRTRSWFGSRGSVRWRRGASSRGGAAPSCAASPISAASG